MTYLSAGRFRLMLAIIVVLHHSLGFFGFGAVAVYLFFTLSGYWITKIYKEKYNYQPTSILKFILSRWLRLFPVLLISTLIFIIAFPNERYRLEEFLHMDHSTLSWWARLSAICGVSGIQHPIPVVWSLDVEAQYYLCAPLITALLGVFCRKPLAQWSLLAISFASGIALMTAGTPATDANLGLFVFFFLAGAMHYKSNIMANSRHMSYGIILFILSCITIAAIPDLRNILTNYSLGRPHIMQVTQNVFMYAAAALLIPLALQSVHNTKPQYDRMLGDMAYPLYMLHMIPLAWYHDTIHDNVCYKILHLGFSLMICAALTFAVYLMVDRPFERLRARLSRKQ